MYLDYTATFFRLRVIKAKRTRMVQLPVTAAIEYVAAGHFFAGGLLAVGLLSGGSFARGTFSPGVFCPGHF